MQSARIVRFAATAVTRLGAAELDDGLFACSDSQLNLIHAFVYADCGPQGGTSTVICYPNGGVQWLSEVCKDGTQMM